VFLLAVSIRVSVSSSDCHGWHLYSCMMWPAVLVCFHSCVLPDIYFDTIFSYLSTQLQHGIVYSLVFCIRWSTSVSSKSEHSICIHYIPCFYNHIVCFSSFFMLPLLSVILTIMFRAFSVPSLTSSTILLRHVCMCVCVHMRVHVHVPRPTCPPVQWVLRLFSLGEAVKTGCWPPTSI
jgi:hypothetical protein